jgi:hypothetical protein
VQEDDVDNAYSLVSEEDKKEFTKEQLEEGFLEVEAEYEVCALRRGTEGANNNSI